MLRINSWRLAKSTIAWANGVSLCHGTLRFFDGIDSNVALLRDRFCWIYCEKRLRPPQKKRGGEHGSKENACTGKIQVLPTVWSTI